MPASDGLPEPNCVRCGGTRFVDVAYRVPNDLAVVNLLCCKECMGVVGAFRSLNPATWVTTPQAQLDWIPSKEPSGALPPSSRRRD